MGCTVYWASKVKQEFAAIVIFPYHEEPLMYEDAEVYVGGNSITIHVKGESPDTPDNELLPGDAVTYPFSGMEKVVYLATGLLDDGVE